MPTVASPLNIAGCDLWCDATQITGLADGAAISSWTDLSGNAHHLVQATGGNQPLYKVGIFNGLPVVRFDGVNDNLFASLTEDVTITVFVVLKKRTAPAATTVQRAFSLTNWDNAGTDLLMGARSDEDATGFMYYPNTASYLPLALGGNSQTTQIVAWRGLDNTNLEYFLEGFRKGVLDPADTVGTSINGLAVGASSAGAEAGDWDVGEVIVYNVNLTDLQMGDVSAYLGLKWGVTGYGATMVANRASGGNVVTATTLSVPMAAGASVAVGNDLLLFVATDNSGTSGAAPTFSISDPKGNVWTLIRSQKVGTVAATGVAGFWYRCTVTVAYANADALTVTLSPTTIAKAFLIEEWTRLGTISVAATDATGTSTAPSIGKTPLAAGETVIGCTFVEGPIADTYTVDSDTTAGWWSTADRVGSGGTTTGAVSVGTQYKRVTSNAAQTFNVTITSRNWVAMAASFAAAPAPYVVRGYRKLQAIHRASVR